MIRFFCVCLIVLVATACVSKRLKLELEKAKKDLIIYKTNNPPSTKTEAQKKQAEFTMALGTWLGRIGGITSLVAIIAFALSFHPSLPKKLLVHIAGISGAVAIGCLTGLAGLEYWKQIAVLIFFCMLFWGGYQLWETHSEHNETKAQRDELAVHFDEAGGSDKLSEKTRAAYAIAKGNKIIKDEIDNKKAPIK